MPGASLRTPGQRRPRQPAIGRAATAHRDGSQAGHYARTRDEPGRFTLHRAGSPVSPLTTSSHDPDRRHPAHRQRAAVGQGRGGERPLPDARAARAGRRRWRASRSSPTRPTRSPPRVRALSARFDLVFTSGGVGPTHDDVTLPAVGGGLRHGRCARNPSWRRCCARGFGDRLHERDLRMADIPVGRAPGVRPAAAAHERAAWPVVVVRNVWVLPGVPAIFRRKFETVRELFRAGADPRARRLLARGRGPDRGRAGRGGRRVPRRSRSARTRTWTRADYRVKITLDGRDAPPSTRRSAAWSRGWAPPSSGRSDGRTDADQHTVVERRAWPTSHPA